MDSVELIKWKKVDRYLPILVLLIFIAAQIYLFMKFEKNLDSSSITDWIQVEIILLTSVFIFTLFKNTSPHFRSEISSEWENKADGILKIKFSFKNISKIAVSVNLFDIKVGILKYRWEAREFETYFPYEENDLADRDSVCLISSEITPFGKIGSGIFYPDEEYSFEKIVLLPPKTIVKVGIRISARLSWLARLSHLSLRKQSEQWTKRTIFLNI